MTDAVEQPTAPPPAPTTVEGAQARLSELTANKEFGVKLMAGDVATRAEFNNLTQLAAGLEKRPDAEELQAITAKEADNRNAADFVKGVRESVDVRDEVLSDVITGAKVNQWEHDAAKAWMARHSADPEWSKKLLAGDADAKKGLFLASVILSSDIKEKV